MEHDSCAAASPVEHAWMLGYSLGGIRSGNRTVVVTLHLLPCSKTLSLFANMMATISRSRLTLCWHVD